MVENIWGNYLSLNNLDEGNCIIQLNKSVSYIYTLEGIAQNNISFDIRIHTMKSCSDSGWAYTFPIVSYWGYLQSNAACEESSTWKDGYVSGTMIILLYIFHRIVIHCQYMQHSIPQPMTVLYNPRVWASSEGMEYDYCYIRAVLWYNTHTHVAIVRVQVNCLSYSVYTRNSNNNARRVRGHHP